MDYACWPSMDPLMDRALSTKRISGGLRSAIRKRLRRRDGMDCAYCGVRMGYDNKLPRPTIDHVVPLHLGGTNGDDNMVLACQSCNEMKGDRPIEELPEAQRERIAAHMRLISGPRAVKSLTSRSSPQCPQRALVSTSDGGEVPSG